MQDNDPNQRGGDDGRGARLDSASSERHKDAAQLFSRLGFEAENPRLLGDVTEGAVNRVKSASGEAYRGRSWERVLFRRELIKVMAGAVYPEEIRAAMDRIETSARDRMTSEVFELVRPSEQEKTARRNANFLDPLQWRISDVAAKSEDDKLLRLSLLASALLSQEEGMAEAKMTLVEAVKRLTKPRE